MPIFLNIAKFLLFQVFFASFAAVSRNFFFSSSRTFFHLGEMMSPAAMAAEAISDIGSAFRLKEFRKLLKNFMIFVSIFFSSSFFSIMILFPPVSFAFDSFLIIGILEACKRF